MGRGRGKGGKSGRGKGRGQSSEQSAAAKQHATEINARRRAEGRETRSTGSITRSQRRAQAHHAAKSKSAPAPDRGRSRSPVREAAPKPAAASSSYYEETDEEAQGHATQATAGEYLLVGAKAKAGTQLQEPSQPSVLPATEKTAQAQKKAKPEEPRTPATKASTKEEQVSTAHKGEEAKDTELHGGTGEALPVATATKEESDRSRDDQPTGSQATGSGELLPGPSVDAAKTTTAPARAEAAKAEGAESDDEYTSESEEEIPTLQGTPLSTGARLWYPSQMPQTLKLIRHLKTGEILPVAAELPKLGFWPNARSLYALPLFAGECAETVHPPAAQRERGRLVPIQFPSRSDVPPRRGGS